MLRKADEIICVSGDTTPFTFSSNIAVIILQTTFVQLQFCCCSKQCALHFGKWKWIANRTVDCISTEFDHVLN